jgi:hypothetical protein
MNKLFEKARQLILAARRETDPHDKLRFREIGGILHKQAKLQLYSNVVFFDDAKARRDERRARRSYPKVG